MKIKNVGPSAINVLAEKEYDVIKLINVKY